MYVIYGAFDGTVSSGDSSKACVGPGPWRGYNATYTDLPEAERHTMGAQPSKRGQRTHARKGNRAEIDRGQWCSGGGRQSRDDHVMERRKHALCVVVV